jgi:hypothetical protein
VTPPTPKPPKPPKPPVVTPPPVVPPTPTPTCTPSNPGKGRQDEDPRKGKAVGRPDYSGDGGVGNKCKGVGPTKRR